MKNKYLIVILFYIASVVDMNAQDTIDTNYYRYGYHFERNSQYFLLDLEMGEVVYDSITGQAVNLCPNGIGFHHYFDTVQFRLFPDPTAFCLYSTDAVYDSIYGIAIRLEKVENFIVGDSFAVILCKSSEDSSHFIPLDSIVIKGGEWGKERWMELPYQSDSIGDAELSTVFFQTIHQNCIDTVEYARVLEFYFDTPVSLGREHIFWRYKLSSENGTLFYTSERWHNNATEWYYDDNCNNLLYGAAILQHFFPILTPLPEWESSKLERVIPNAHELPDDPDPDPDPEPEAIDDVYGNLPISIYPNPTDGMTTISSPEAIKELTVTDLAGRVMLHQSSLGTTTTLDTAPLEPGLYLLKVTTTSGTATTKLAVR